LGHKLPDFPWDALAPYGATAKEHPAGIIDLSVGTPVDPTPELIQSALRDATGDFAVLPLIGSKEFVAWLPTFLTAQSVLYPEVAYPTYLVGALLAKAEAITVDIDASKWPRADVAWVNSPSNPTGRVHSESEYRAAINWARTTGGVVVSDECYLEFGTNVTPSSILNFTNGNNKNILAVHSLSKRSNLAGYRGAFVIGDPALIAQILEVRKHAGMMVPLPIQKAMVVALSDSAHVGVQRDRYNIRKKTLAPALAAAGFTIDFSDAGLYMWATRNEDCWASVAWLTELGILATPGIFYGEKGSQHIRIAMTATDAQISEAAARILAKVAK
jgi:succinyldiaminopimelate transaminase